MLIVTAFIALIYPHGKSGQALPMPPCGATKQKTESRKQKSPIQTLKLGKQKAEITRQTLKS
jgi:hypothetical protein